MSLASRDAVALRSSSEMAKDEGDGVGGKQKVTGSGGCLT
jgi:hypothetical protein